MVHYKEEWLKNGLQVLVSTDATTPMVAINVLYKVGSRNESPERTGFAHLFEHLMFGGSANVDDFDEHLQRAGGENNAFTTNDFTNYYSYLPAKNIETALWLESDRMKSLRISKKTLDVQRKVVIEEFKETCFEEPYGLFWHKISNLAYQKHPYRWPVIGQTVEHIENANLDDVREFYQTWYAPNNAILSIVGNIEEKEAFRLAEKWFGDVPSNQKSLHKKNDFPLEAEIEEPRRTTVQEGNIPVSALYLAFKMPGRIDDAFYATDLLSDVLADGPSSRFYRRLKKEKKLFSHIDAYITANFDPGLFIIEGKPAEGVSFQEAEAAIWEELQLLQTTLVDEREIQKIKNHQENFLTFSEMNAMGKAQNLGYYSALEKTELINDEPHLYQSKTPYDLQTSANELFVWQKHVALMFQQ